MTHDEVRNALQGSTVRTVQKSVSLPVLNRYSDWWQRGSEPPAIKMDGDTIVDGNHRFIVSLVLGKQVSIQEWQGSLIPSHPLSSIEIDDADWPGDYDLPEALR